MAAPWSTLDWRRLSQDERDRGLNNGAAVPNSGEIVAGWDRLSCEMRASHPDHLDLRYGPRERNRIDFLKAEEGGPTLVFIHGGYWQTRAKESFTLFAAGPLAHGINVALIGYTLAPDASIDEIVGEVGGALDALVNRLPALGGNPDRIVVTGWSAGGHLTSMALAHSCVKAGLAISGIFDLEPIRHSYLNAKLGLEAGAIERNSPLRQPAGIDKPLSLVVGSAELPLLRQQTADFAAHRAKLGLPVTYEEIPAADHFSIMDQLASPGGRITKLIRQLFERTA